AATKARSLTATPPTAAPRRRYPPTTGPTRRKDLLALLRSFDADDTPPGAATFDPDRIRGALGLDGGAT
ncbi:MAG TPA: hypothetical protein PKA98_22145, partial [Acidimicrobiales bacterium]|nr:hypothetical protein [Acidimicrobiales bacterium]